MSGRDRIDGCGMKTRGSGRMGQIEERGEEGTGRAELIGGFDLVRNEFESGARG
jgi:hypothetical protein